MRNAWFSFWHVLWSGEWVANVGLPMLVSLIALVVAYIFFRRQLSSDRQLMREQMEIDRAEGERSRRREIVQQLGHTLFNSRKHEFFRRPHEVDWAPFVNSVSDLSLRAIAIAGPHELFQYVLDVSIEMDYRLAMVNMRRRNDQNAPSGAVLGVIANGFIADCRKSLLEAATLFVNWDGESALDRSRLKVVATTEPDIFDPAGVETFHEARFADLDLLWSNTDVAIRRM